MNAVANWIQSAVQAQPGSGGLPATWLDAVRSQALQRFAAEGWPTTRLEGWRHTSLATLGTLSFNTVSAPAQGLADRVQAVRGQEQAHWLVFVNGCFVPELSAVGTLPQGATVCTLAHAQATQPDLVQQLFGHAEQGSAVQSLNTALATDGAFIHVRAGVSLEHPVHVLHVASGEAALNVSRTLFLAETGACFTLVEQFIGHESGASLTSTVTLGTVQANAQVTHLKLQQEDDQAWHLGALHVQQEKGSVFNQHAMSFGARLARHDITTQFNGDHCETLFNGLYYVNGKRHVDHATRIGHGKPHGISREYYRGILDDQARGVFTGRILVAPGADKTDAVQRSDSLLLSRLARSDARPELEIYADDVKCAHGATVGQIDPDSLFYLRSRGLDAQSARQVLTYAFAAEAIERIESEALRARVIQAIGALAPAGLNGVRA